jgi:hypothetical protein
MKNTKIKFTGKNVSSLDWDTKLAEAIGVEIMKYLRN